MMSLCLRMCYLNVSVISLLTLKTLAYVEFNRSDENEVVHALARVATSIANSQVFIYVPTCIAHLIINEML